MLSFFLCALCSFIEQFMTTCCLMVCGTHRTREGYELGIIQIPRNLNCHNVIIEAYFNIISANDHCNNIVITFKPG